MEFGVCVSICAFLCLFSIEISLCSLRWHKTRDVDQAGLELKEFKLTMTLLPHPSLQCRLFTSLLWFLFLLSYILSASTLILISLR